MLRITRTRINQIIFFLCAGAAGFLIGFMMAPADAMMRQWEREWPLTDFSKHSVDLKEIKSGGPSKDGIPSIDRPNFVPAQTVTALGTIEPVISVSINGDARAYPLRVLMRHEIVNDLIGGVPVAVTYCPLCNAAIVFDRRIDGEAVEFGTTGNLRNSDLVMYDRTTESWWQQFTGEAIVGVLTGSQLKVVASRLESWERFLVRHPDGQVLSPRFRSLESYGGNPYVEYDTARNPFLYRGPLPKGIEAMARVVVIGDEAWPLERLRQDGAIETTTHIMTWKAGQNSALDTRDIARGRDVGNVVVQRKGEGGLVDAVHDVTFAFVFEAFHPEGTWHLD